MVKDRTGQENQTGEVIRVNPIIAQPGAVKPLYLEFIRAKERGQIGKGITWEEFQTDEEMQRKLRE